MIHAIQRLLPKFQSKIQFSGVIEDFTLFFHDLDQLKPEWLDTMTTWLEHQITDLTHLTTLQVRCSYIQDILCGLF